MNYIDIAEEYISEGLNPLPLKDNKAPNLEVNHPFLYEQINNVENRFKDTDKIGIACGSVSGGFYCMDFDAHNDEPISDIYESFIEIPYIQEMLHDGLLSIYKTAGGGYHIYFKYDSVEKGQKLAQWKTKAVMIEIRGNGQYVACHPSPGYQHIEGVELLKLEYINEADHIKLIENARSFNRYEDITPRKAEVSDRKWADSWKDSTPDGKYNLEHGPEAIDLLYKAGWQLSHTRRDGVQYWTRPNKDARDGFSATFGHQKNMFYVFSEDGNCKPFEAHTAYSPFNIYTILKHEGDWKKAKDTLRERFNMVNSEEFWSRSEKGNFSLNNRRFKEFLENNDFFKTSPNDKSTFDFIRKEGIFLNIVYEKDIKDFVIDWIEYNKCEEGVFNLVTGNLKYFKREFLSLLKTLPVNPLKDNQNECFLFYRNCIVQIDKHGKKELSYDEVDMSVWRGQVIDRDYVPSDHHSSEYRRFIWLIAGQNPERYKAFQTLIGYLLHNHKDMVNNKAVIFNDEVISENPNGRSGKGLFWNALKKLRKVQSLDGKTFDFRASFPYQNVSTDCQILVFDDVNKHFNFENLFSVITEGITIEYKGKDSIKLEVTESPKIIITTNYTIKGDSASHNARKYEVEMSSYFSDKYTPVMEFGHEFFNGWNDEEWARFDNYMMECISIYMNMGLIDMPNKNLATRKLLDDISLDLFNFLENMDRNKWYKMKSLYDDYLNLYPEKRNKFTQNKMTRSFKEYCNYKGVKGSTATVGGVTQVYIEDLSKEIPVDEFEQITEAPF
jgi:hypothetical protein